MESLGVDVLGEDTLGGLPYGAAPSTTGVLFPLLLIEEAFTTDPLAETPAFVDLGADNMLVFTATQNTRSSQLDAPSVGSFDATFDGRFNRDLDPTNPDSPYAPNVAAPNRRGRLRIIADGVTYPICEWFANKNIPRFSKPANAFFDLSASDAFKILATTSLTGMPARPKERADVRVTAILDWVGWPMSRRLISRARTILIPEDISDRNALDALVQLDATECGRLTVDQSGNVVFLSRGDMNSATRQTVSQATFSDSGVAGTIPYDDPQIDPSDDMVRNIIEISCPGKDTITLEDAASRAFYGPKSFKREVRDFTESARHATAEHFLAAFKDKHDTVLGLTVLTSDYPPGFETGLFAKVAQLRVGDRVTFEQVLGRDTPFVQECFIESKVDSAAIETKLWSTSLGFSYAPPVVSRGKWGSAPWGSGKWGW